jgi:hypothetical protein
MAGTVMPAPKFVGLDNNANPVSGGKLYTYLAGTTTPQPTYSDVNLTVANANPVGFVLAADVRQSTMTGADPNASITLTSTMRTSVASMNTARARPRPNSFN